MRPTTPRSPSCSVGSLSGRAVTVYDSRGRAIDLRLSMRELRAAARAAGIPDIPTSDEAADRESLERYVVRTSNTLARKSHTLGYGRHPPAKETRR